MNPIFFIFALLLAGGLYACSFGEKDSADADYCFYFENNDVKGNDKNKSGYVNFLLLKQNNRFEPIVLDTARKYLECYGRAAGTSFDIDFTDASDAAFFSKWFEGHSYSSEIWGCIDCYDDSGTAYKIKTVKQVELPTVITKKIEGNRKREDFLRFKNRIFNAHKSESFTCESYDLFAGHPIIDTSYQIDFRVRITGKCGYLATKILPVAPEK
jgi:hypothetical protein